MHRRPSTRFIPLILLLSLASPGALAAEGGQVVHVPGDYRTITQAVADAEPGATILIGPGVWRENLVLPDKALTLIGSDARGGTTLMGDGWTAPVRLPSSDALITLSHLSITNRYRPILDPSLSAIEGVDAHLRLEEITVYGMKGLALDLSGGTLSVDGLTASDVGGMKVVYADADVTRLRIQSSRISVWFGVCDVSLSDVQLSGFGRGGLSLVNSIAEVEGVSIDGVEEQEALYIAGSDLRLTDVQVNGAHATLDPTVRVDASTLVAQGLTLMGNDASGWPTLYVLDSDVTLVDTVVEGNQGSSAVRISDSVGSVTGMILRDNPGRGLGVEGAAPSPLVFDDLRIEGNGSGAEIYGAPLVTLRGCEILDNLGSAIYFKAGAGDPGVRVEGCTLAGNVATRGAGVYAVGGAPLLLDVEIEGNEAAEGGGGMWLEQLALPPGTFDGVSLRGNRAPRGGGLYATDLQGDLSGALLEGNAASEEGGGAWIQGGAVTGLTLRTNTAPEGAGAYLSGAGVADVVAQGNRGFHGGGLFVTGAGSVTRAWLAENVADDLGAGLAAFSSTSDLSQIAAVGNTARAAGGMYLYQHTGAVSGATLAANRATGGVAGGIFVDGGAPAVSHLVAAGNQGGSIQDDARCIGDGCAWAWSVVKGGASGVVPGEGYVSADPLLLGMPAVGSAAGADLHLSLTSPAVDLGGGMDADGSPRDAGIYGGPAGALWDVDRDGLPAYAWPGAFGDAPPGVDPAAFDADDLAP